MHKNILRLPESVINQIAAGEVVENPASIVKELIENSIDAGAKHIVIEIKGGGQQLIRVEDDGCGMEPDDALLSIERHATSKIRTAEDLQLLGTMGFRGEALAAISSVAHFELLTAANGPATRILAEGGAIQKVEPCARNRGTTIEVRSLFFNVPARKKFQKSQKTNTSQVARIVETVALAHPEISFSLIVQEKKIFHVDIQDWKERIEEILGSYEHPVEWQSSGLSIKGFISAPAHAMANRTGQYLFINRRPIFSPLISRAVKEGYATRIGEHAYPPYVLFLTIDSHLVDVNVHPQKKEARFQDESAMFKLFQEAVGKTFAPHSPSFSAPLFFTPPPAFSFPFPEPFIVNETAAPAPELDLQFIDRPLAVLGSYLLLQKERLILVDLSAAHARILYEQLKREEKQIQALIWPLEIELMRGEEEVLAEELSGVGIECRVLQRILIVDALPAGLEASDFPLFLKSWREKKKWDQIANYFCRGLKKRYGLDEAIALWRQLQKCQDRLYDPLGKPIWAEIAEEMLEQIIKHG